MIDTIINTLDNHKNALVESPTGTGKTLCLLTSTLAFINNWKETNPTGDPPKVYYASRTHSQLSQAMKELKNTAYT